MRGRWGYDWRGVRGRRGRVGEAFVNFVRKFLNYAHV
jgi:hypothetical protein